MIFNYLVETLHQRQGGTQDRTWRGPNEDDAHCEQGRVHRSTVYSYFPNRDAVLAECFLRAVTAVLDAAESCWETDEPFADQLVNSCIVGLAVTRESPTMRMLTFDDELGRTYRAASASEKWQNRLQDDLGERFAAAAKGEVRDDVAPETMAH
ncbi:TetR/AcrR family transcriptional regulator [Mycobacterium paraseoulense]|uniref:TetR/AcrR family transcriptional regulator n=1 Tax=Mycobacterium TaxID=1763 RepID=UPI001580CCBF|nr:TetR/AcrR family transcriptional regulator [Mycobacterium paraseoulense]MCV7398101.1 TetR/AcrR family transcriptional regulator [Mycobacterium paraseoulense]